MGFNVETLGAILQLRSFNTFRKEAGPCRSGAGCRIVGPVAVLTVGEPDVSHNSAVQLHGKVAGSS